MRSRLILLSLSALALAGCQTAGGIHRQAPAPSPTQAPATQPPPPTASGNQAPASPWAEARARGMAFRATGNEPGWSVEVQKSRTPTLFVTLQNNQRHIQVPQALVSSDQEAGMVKFRGTAKDGTPVQLTIHRGQCTDDMSGQKFAASAQLSVGARMYTGCGKFLIQ